MLDPNSIHISHHARLRYLERRQWPKDQDHYAAADEAIRNLLVRCADRNPPLHIRDDDVASRRYRVGEMVFIVSPDNRTLITMFSVNPSKSRSKKDRLARRGRT
jgi:hypothetical protein